MYALEKRAVAQSDTTQSGSTDQLRKRYIKELPKNLVFNLHIDFSSQQRKVFRFDEEIFVDRYMLENRDIFETAEVRQLRYE